MLLLFFIKPIMSTNQPKLPELLSSLTSVKIISNAALPEGLVDAKPLFYHINRYATVPSAKLSLYDIEPEKDGWLSICLRYIDLDSNCYLFVLNSADGWYWTEVGSPNHAGWITELLVRQDIDDFMVLSYDQKGFAGFIEEEYDYLAFAYEDVRILAIEA